MHNSIPEELNQLHSKALELKFADSLMERWPAIYSIIKAAMEIVDFNPLEDNPNGADYCRFCGSEFRRSQVGLSAPDQGAHKSDCPWQIMKSSLQAMVASPPSSPELL